MKRKLSLLLAVIMLLGTFQFAFAADEVKPADFLEKEGILQGNDSGDLMLDKPLLRKDAVVLLSRLLGVEDEAKSFEKEGLPTFNDLAGNPYYNKFLAWAEDKGYFTGKTDGSFGYTDNLEAKEYAIVLLRALEYVNDDKANEWKTAWDEAKKLGLLEGIKTEERDDILREDVAKMTFNALGVKMKGSDKTLADKLGIELPAPAELKAEVKDTENLKEVVVSLSNAKLIEKEDRVFSTSNYRISGNEIERVELKDNDIILQVKNTLRNGKGYELQIKGVDKAIDGKYKFIARDNTIPAVEKVEVLGEYGIKVVTTEPIKDVRGRNFLVDGRTVVMDVEKYGRNLILTPYSGSFAKNAETLTVTGLEDFAGFKSAKEEFEIEIVEDKEAPKVVDALLKGNKVEVVFDKDIYEDSVAEYNSRSSVGNISYELGRHTIYADKAKKVDTNKVEYTFKDNEVPSRRDEVTIVDVTNHSKVKMEKTTIGLREILDDVEPEILEKKITKRLEDKTATIELHFNKNVEGDFVKGSDNEFVVKSHFALYEDEVSKRNELKIEDHIVSARYGKKDGKDVKDVIVVELKDLKPYKARTETDFEYILEIEGFADATSSRNKMYRDYYEFKFDKASDFVVEKVTLDEVGIDRRDTLITIKFSKELDREIAEDATNYIFYTEKGGRRTSAKDVKQLDGEAILRGNGTEVELEIPKELSELKKDYDGLRILDVIKDRRGNRLSRTFYYDFDAKELLEEGQTLDEKAVAEVEKLVNASIKEDKKIEELKLEDIDEKKVKEAREAYDNLTSEQRKSDSARELGKKLEAIEKRVTELRKEAQTFSQAVEAVEKVLEEIEATNESTTKSAIEAKVKEAVINDKINSVVKVTQTPATEATEGEVKVEVELSLTEDVGNITKVIKKTIKIDILPQSLDTAAKEVEKLVNETVATSGAIEVSNTTTEDDILNEVREVIKNKDIRVRISNFDLVKAEGTNNGKITGDVVLELGSKLETVEIHLIITNK